MNLNPPSNRYVAAGYWGFGLAVFYAVFVRFLQAAGVTIGLSGTVDPALEQRFHLASYEFGVFILLAGTACLMLVRPELRIFPAWLPICGGKPASRPFVLAVLVVPTLLGGSYAVAHGAFGEIVKILDLAGIMTIHQPVSLYVTSNRAAGDWWNILFYEPWFLGLGCCAGLSVLAWARQSLVRDSTIRLVAIAFVAFALALTAGEMLAVLTHHTFAIGLVNVGCAHRA